MASLQSMKGRRMSFIMVWKVAGELHSPKSLMSGSKSPWFVEKAAFHSSPSLRWTLLKPQQRSRVVDHSALCNLVTIREMYQSLLDLFPMTLDQMHRSRKHSEGS